MNELPLPSMEDELRRAAERLAQAAGPWSERPSHDDRVNDALAAMRRGEAVQGYRAFIEMADSGDATAWHFLAWIHRYRAEIALRAALECHERAIALGYAPSRLHMEKVWSALELVAYPTDEQLARASKPPPEDSGG